MNICSSDSVSFKSYYKVRGEEGVLAEVCSYLRFKNRRVPEFDFLDLRILERTPTSKERALCNVRLPDIKELKEIPRNVIDFLMDQISIRKGTMAPEALEHPFNIDLFVTNEHKQPARLETDLAISEHYSSSIKPASWTDPSLSAHIEAMVHDAQAVDNAIRKRVPVVNLNPAIISRLMAHLHLGQTPLLDADMVLRDLQHDRFDFVHGQNVN